MVHFTTLRMALDFTIVNTSLNNIQESLQSTMQELQWFIAGFGRFIITMISLFQFISLLFTEKPNEPLIKFGQTLNTYLYDINQFLTVNTEAYPFPFSDWPTSTPNNEKHSDEKVDEIETPNVGPQENAEPS